MSFQHSSNHWWRNANIYEIFIRTFSDSNGDGIGDLTGIIQRLDYLHGLGVDAIWITPFYPSPLVDDGYDVSDYRAVDQMYGTLSDLRELIDQLHRRNMRLIIDLVLNHSSDQHEWFRESCKSKENPYRDFYIWRPPRADGSPPTNWASAMRGSTWTLDPTTGEYYLHMFTKHQPDLNWDNPRVRSEMASLIRYWMEFGVDGFRMDVISMISKDLRDADITEPGSPFQSPWNRVLDGPNFGKYIQELLSVARKANPAAFFLGECVHIHPHDFYGYDSAYRVLDSVIHFELISVDIDPATEAKFGKWSIRKREEVIPDIASTAARWQKLDVPLALYLNGHDQPRSVSRYGNDTDPLLHEKSAKMLATWIFSQRGFLSIYQGEEIGMTNPTFPTFEHFYDPETLITLREQRGKRPDAELLDALRSKAHENARSPMQWTDQKWTPHKRQLPTNDNCAWINVAKQINDPNSILSYYKALLRLRGSSAVLQRGSTDQVLKDHKQLAAHIRRLENEGVLVLTNWTEETVDGVTTLLNGDPVLKPLKGSSVEVLLANYDDAKSLKQLPARLRPYESIVCSLVQ